MQVLSQGVLTRVTGSQSPLMHMIQTEVLLSCTCPHLTTVVFSIKLAGL